MKNYIFVFKTTIMLLGFQLFANPSFASDLSSLNENADFALTVTGGTGSGTYASGATVDITAGAAPSGQVFDRWVINGGAPVFGSIYSATTTLTMPSTVASITALFMPEGPTFFDACEELVSTSPEGGTWARTGTTLNTTDMVQGAGCLEYDQTVNTSTTLFTKINFTTPVNTGATVSNGMLRFKFWIEDPTKLGANLSIELRSGTEAAAEHQWNVTKANVVAGWNSFNLPFSAITLVSPNLGADLTAINFFRIYSSGSVGVKAKLDAMMVFDPTVAKVDPEITWANPADVAVNSALSSTQLNATSNVAGTLAYTPASGTILPAVESKELSVTFKPLNLHAFCYNTVTKTVNINVVATSGVDNANDIAFNMYPNPLKKDGVLHIKGDLQDNCTLNIINLNGQVVYTKKLNGSEALNVNGILKPGMYMISITSDKSTVNRKLVVK